MALLALVAPSQRLAGHSAAHGHALLEAVAWLIKADDLVAGEQQMLALRLGFLQSRVSNRLSLAVPQIPLLCPSGSVTLRADGLPVRKEPSVDKTEVLCRSREDGVGGSASDANSRANPRIEKIDDLSLSISYLEGTSLRVSSR